MALSQSALLEVLDALKVSDSEDVIRAALQVILQQLIEAEATSVIGAGPYERTDSRTTQRNGHRDRVLTTAAGDVELAIPKLRVGSFFPSLLERRRRIDQALFAVVMEAYVTGTSVRKVDDLVKALGADSGISKSEVSRICAELDAEVAAFADRDLTATTFPYVFLDATYCKARVGGTKNGKGSRVASQAVVVATGVGADGRREVLGFAVGDSEDGAFWTAFLRSLKARGLAGTQLVISDAHTGLRAAIDAVLIGASWQRCRVHFLRNVLAQVPKGSAEMVAAAVRTVFAQPDTAHVREQLDVIATMLGRQFPKVETMLRDAADRHHRLRRLPGQPLEKGVVHQPARTGQQRDQAPNRRGRRLPQPDRTAAAGRLGPDRSPRRMASRRPPLPLRRIHGTTDHQPNPDQQGGCHTRTHRVIVQPAPPRSRTRSQPAVTPRGGT